MRAADFLTQQSKKLLENKQHAVFCAGLLALVPFVSWLSVALVTLVTLRKGARPGFEVLLPALVVHTVPLMLLMPVPTAAVNTLVAYLPCYFAAYALRQTGKWQTVAAVFFIQALATSLLLHWIFPDFISGEFVQLKEFLSLYKEYPQLLEATNNEANALVLSELFLGVQILSASLTALFSLLFARSIQAKLFKPGGLKQELKSFRGGRAAVICFALVLAFSYQKNQLAINLLPMTLSYFLASGLGLAYFVFAQKKQTKVYILLGLGLVLKPFFVLFACVVVGLLDSIFNFRIYLPRKVREST
jgi:hypothetical protein